MTKEEYIDRFITLDTCFELAKNSGDEKEASKIGSEIMALHIQMRTELTDEECYEVNDVLDAVLLNGE